MTDGVVVFSYAMWSARYPELAGSVAEPLAQAYFNEAGLYLDNTPASPVQNWQPGGTRAVLLNMVTAHIAKLNATIGGVAPSGLVGAIASATEGSVSVSVANNYPPGSVQWWQATTYGAAFWAATTAYRTMKYIPGHPRVMDPYAPFGVLR